MKYIANIKCGTKRKHPHNARCRYTHGYKCEDCGEFIKSGTLEYFMTESISGIWMTLNNRHIKHELPKDVKELMDKIWTSDDDFIYNLTETEAEEFRIDTYAILAKHGIIDDESSITLK